MVWRRFHPPVHPGTLLNRTVANGSSKPAFRIGFVGDICPLFGYTPVLDPDIVSFFSDCDTIVGNFEGVFSRRRWRPYLMLHDERTLPLLQRIAPFERWILSVANNHTADAGDAGLLATVTHLENLGIRVFGTRKVPTVPVGERTCISAWSWWSNLPSSLIQQEIPGLFSKGDELSIAFPHWGYEGERVPRPDQRPPAGFALTVGHHSHLPQPLEGYGQKAHVAWSLGNFVTGKRLRMLGEGSVLKAGVVCSAGSGPRIAELVYKEIRIDHDSRRRCGITFRNPLPA